jgi:hypothetical protein
MSKVNYITGHKKVNHDDEVAPFDNYLLVDTNDTQLDAYGITDDAPLDIETLLNEVYGDDADVEVYDHNFTSINACIKTDGNSPADCRCWASSDFGFKE